MIQGLIKYVFCQGDLVLDSRRGSVFMGLLLFAALLFPNDGQASLKDVRSCFTIHLRDAMSLNKQRAPWYEKLSNGRSREISEKLIGAERQVLFIAPLVDAWAAPYQNAGIPILCKDMIDMSQTPAFKAHNPAGVDSIHNFRPANVEEMSARLMALYRAKDLGQMVRYADEQIRELEKVPRYNCMVRHILESIRRMAALAPVYDRQAKNKMMISPMHLSRAILKSHIGILDTSSEIDILAAPLQAEALPIICQDVPHIPLP